MVHPSLLLTALKSAERHGEPIEPSMRPEPAVQRRARGRADHPPKRSATARARTASSLPILAVSWRSSRIPRMTCKGKLKPRSTRVAQELETTRRCTGAGTGGLADLARGGRREQHWDLGEIDSPTRPSSIQWCTLLMTAKRLPC